MGQKSSGWNARAVARMAALALSPALADAQISEPPTRVQVAEGIYVFMTPPYGEVGLDGNSVVILSNDGVLVFDTNGTPAAAEVVLAEIRKLTDKPVKYVVNSHWHWDHWYGTEVYRRAFPDVHVITHEKTRETDDGAGPRVQPAWSRRGPSRLSRRSRETRDRGGSRDAAARESGADEVRAHHGPVLPRSETQRSSTPSRM